MYLKDINVRETLKKYLNQYAMLIKTSPLGFILSLLVIAIVAAFLRIAIHGLAEGFTNLDKFMDNLWGAWPITLVVMVLLALGLLVWYQRKPVQKSSSLERSSSSEG